jgi:molybdopterin synthase catalytic subunit
VNRFLVRPEAGATVVFTGTTRDHAGDREGVDLLTYEAYESAARPRLEEVLDEARARWPEVVALVALHRVGEVPLCEPAVIVGASSPHRAAAFAAAHFCIDAVKATVPLWKRERHSGGEDWGLDGSELVDATSVGGPPTAEPTGPDQ